MFTGIESQLQRPKPIKVSGHVRTPKMESTSYYCYGNNEPLNQSIKNRRTIMMSLLSVGFTWFSSCALLGCVVLFVPLRETLFLK
jgi:hypothetical protein